MNQKIENGHHFSFKEVSISEIERELGEINLYKPNTSGNLLTKIFR